MGKTALYTGSFDPITRGHVDVVRAGAAFCDRLLVAIGVHPGKSPMFRPEEKAAFIRDATADIVRETGCKIDVVFFDGLAVDAAREHGASMLLRGLRDGTDFDYEMQMAGMNRAMAPEVQTVFLPASPEVRHITGTLVRQIASMGADVEAFAPRAAAAALRGKFSSPPT
jgi:pantetheine-phosphate adenylyltransferase